MFQINYNNELIECSIRGDYEGAKIALERGANPSAIRMDRASSLELACYKGHRKIAKMLVENGADVHITNRFHSTPLHLSRHPETTLSLIRAGAIVDAKDHLGNSPLMRACLSGRAEVAAHLLAHDASPFLQNRWGATPLCVVTKSENLALKALFEENCGGDPR